MSSYALRLPESLKKASKRLAAADSTTMNQFFVIAIAEKISALETADFFQQRGENGFKERADKVWTKVAKRKPLPEGDWTPA